MLQLMHNESPDVEYLDLSNKNITQLEKIIVEIAKFENVKDLHLANNNFKTVPSNLNDYLFRIQNLNLNQVDFHDFTATIRNLATLSELRSLYVNLVEEDQVD
jgi:Leucine-rich repeat (LRR) protein